MRPRSSMSTVVVVISTLVVLLVGCAGNKETTSTPVSTNPPSRSITGVVTYAGNVSPTHQIIVVAGRIGEQGSPAYSAVLKQPGAYTISNVTDASYNIFAFMDLGDDMGSPQPNEPSGYYDLNKDGQGDEVIMIDGKGLTGINITLYDPK